MRHTETTERQKKCLEVILVTLIVQLILFQLSGFLPPVVKLIFTNASQAFKSIASESVSILAYIAVFCIPTYIIVKYANDDQKTKKLCFSCRISAPKKAVSIFFTALGGVTLIGYFTYFFKTGIEIAGIGIHNFPISIPDDFWGIVLTFVSSVIIPAIVEELLFRGALLHTLLPHGHMFAIIFSSAAFSIMHCNPLQFLYAFFGGLIFSYATIKSGSIFFSIILHFTNNFISFALLLIDKYAADEIAIAITSYTDLFFIIMGLIGAVHLVLNGFFAIGEKRSPFRFTYKDLFNMYTAIYILYAIYLTSRWFYII